MNFFKRLGAESDDTVSLGDARLAFGALLVRLARSDGHYDADEIARIDTILARRFTLSPQEAAALRAQCEIAEAEASDTVRFTREIKETVPLEERNAIVKAMWQVVLADDARDENEDQIMRLTAQLLGVSDQDSHRLRFEAMQS